jgi:hypothetical protein
MELECSDIDRIHMHYIMYEEYLGKTPSRRTDIQRGLSGKRIYSYSLQESRELAC